VFFLADLDRPALLPPANRLHDGLQWPTFNLWFQFGAGLAKMGEAIDYPNFKDEVAKEMDIDREMAYLKVWEVMRKLGS
jgi:hypothetical protein